MIPHWKEIAAEPDSVLVMTSNESKGLQYVHIYVSGLKKYF